MISKISNLVQVAMTTVLLTLTLTVSVIVLKDDKESEDRHNKKLQ
jgi:hypothetical protein